MKNHDDNIVPETIELLPVTRSTAAPARNFETDPFFSNLLPKLPAEHRQSLKQSIAQHGGCISPVVVWPEQRILLDGNHRLALVDELRAEGAQIAEPVVIEKP